MSYNNNYPNPYYNNYNNNGSNYSTNSTSPTSPTSPYTNMNGSYYNRQGSPTSPYTNMNGNYYNRQGSPTITSTSNYPPGNRRVQDLGQRSLTNVNTGNNSTGSLSGATAVGIPPVELTRNADDVGSMDLHRPGVYNQTNDATVLRQYTGDEADEEQSSFPDPMSTKRESRTGLTSTPLMERNLDDTGGQHYNDYNQSSGYFSQYNNYYRQDDPYYDEGSSRHNTLTSKYPPYGNENDYTDRDFPGGGKNARQTMFGEDFGLPEKRKKRCCGCCSWTICLVITLIVLTALGITGFFVWPRIPKVDIKEGVPASQPNLSTNPPFIGMKINMTVEIDNRENYVPYKFNKIDVAVFDRAASTDKSIATGSKPDYTLQPKRIDTIEFPITVNYTAESINDPVIQDFIAACSPQSKTNTPLRLRVEVVLFVWGIDWIYKPKISVPIPDMKCPVPEL